MSSSGSVDDDRHSGDHLPQDLGESAAETSLPGAVP